jgi:uncharacterized repeat protein (TIGR01451 family)
MADNEILHRTFQVIATTAAGQIITNDDYLVHASNLMTPTYGAAVSTIVSPLDVSIDKTALDFGLAGRTMDYTIRMDFDGVAQADHVIVTDTLPVSVTYASDTSGFPPTFPSADQVVWDFGDVLTTTQAITFTLTVTPSIMIANNTLLTNQVVLSTDTYGDPPGNNTAQAQCTVYQIVPIATARAGSPPQVFAIEGQVTYLPGTYSASDWGLQDASGGIVAYFSPDPAVALGDYVQVVATRADYYGQEEMSYPVLGYTNLRPGTEVTPTNFTTAQVDSGSSEGWLTHVEGIVSGLGTCSTTADYSFYVDDGSGPAQIFMDHDVGVDVCVMGAANGKIIRITGFSSQHNAFFELKPRNEGDIDVDANQPWIAKQAP